MSATCALCGGQLGRSLMVISQPDRFERHVGIAAEGYRRSWDECGTCGGATNVMAPGNQERLAEIEAAYYAVDLAHVDIGERYRKIMALPPGGSDNSLRTARILDFMASRPVERWRVLDVGAGMGVFLSRLLQDGGDRIAQAVGIEPDGMAAAHLSSLGLFQVINESFPPKADPGVFDLVTLNKVLEHMSDPVAFLRQVAKAVDPEKGLFHVEVPDVLTALYRQPTDNIVGALHRHLYSIESLAMVLRAAGFIPLTVSRVVEPSGKLSVFAFAALPQAIGKAAA